VDKLVSSYLPYNLVTYFLFSKCWKTDVGKQRETGYPCFRSTTKLQVYRVYSVYPRRKLSIYRSVMKALTFRPLTSSARSGKEHWNIPTAVGWSVDTEKLWIRYEGHFCNNLFRAVHDCSQPHAVSSVSHRSTLN